MARGSIRKIGSIGLRIQRGVSSHGLSINVTSNLEPFTWINSCGIEACQPTSIAAELKTDRFSVEEVGRAVAGALADRLGMEAGTGKPGLVGLAGAEDGDSVA